MLLFGTVSVSLIWMHFSRYSDVQHGLGDVPVGALEAQDDAGDAAGGYHGAADHVM